MTWLACRHVVKEGSPPCADHFLGGNASSQAHGAQARAQVCTVCMHPTQVLLLLTALFCALLAKVNARPQPHTALGARTRPLTSPQYDVTLLAAPLLCLQNKQLNTSMTHLAAPPLCLWNKQLNTPTTHLAAPPLCLWNKQLNTSMIHLAAPPLCLWNKQLNTSMICFAAPPLCLWNKQLNTSMIHLAASPLC